MKKILTFLLTALLTFGVGWAETVTYNIGSSSPASWSGGSTGATSCTTPDGFVINITSANSNNSGYIGWNSGNTTMTISHESYVLQSIVATCSNGDPSKVAVASGNGSITYTGTSFTWSTGSSDEKSVSLKYVSGKQLRISKLVITYSAGSTPSGPKYYHKVTSNDELVVGNKYIIVYESGNQFLGAVTTSTTGYGAVVSGPTISGRQVDIDDYSDITEWTLGDLSGSSSLNFTLNNGSGYLSFNRGSIDNLYIKSSISSDTNYSKWKAEFDADGGCTLNNGGSGQRYIQFNSSLPGFTCATSYQNAYLYVEGEAPVLPTVEAPSFEPDGGVFTGSASVTITSDTEGATIYYTTDGTDPVVNRSSIANGGTVELTESCTLKAMAVKSGMDNSAIVTSQAYTITSGGGSDSKIYRKVTSTDDLVAGQKYIIMLENANSSVGMGAYDGSKHFNGVQNLTISNDKVNIANTEVLELTLGGTTGAWTLYTGSGYIQGADAVQFNIVDNATAANSKWIITNSVDNTNGFVVENAQYDRYIKCYSNSTFRHYGSGNGSWAYLYVQTSNNEPALHAEPNPLNINDTNETGGKTGTIYVSGENLGGDNVGVDSYDPNHSTNFSSNPGYFSHNGTVTDYPVAITYTGQALSATGIVYPANNIASTSVNINYLYTGPIYVIGDVNNTYWDNNNGAQMTRDENGVYSTTVSVQQSDGTAGYFTFSKQFGSNFADGQFGPVSNDNWWYNDDLNDIYQPIDTLGNKHNIRILPGTYTITVNPATNEFKIKRYVIDVTISPADGTHFTGSTISGTITSDPAGTIEWSTDGNNWQAYTDGFTATVDQVGGSVTVYARSTSNGVTSDVVSATYTRDLAPAPEAPSFSIGSSAVAAGTVITITAPEGCTLYVDGQQVSNPYDVTINSHTTISAYCVNDEGTQSTTVTNSYTIATVCNAIIEFKDNGSDDQDATSWSAMSDYFEAGKDYLDGASGISRVFKGTTGLKYGNSSNGGTITFSLYNETEWKVSHITLNAKSYNGNNVTFTVSTNNGQSETTSAIGNNLGGYTLDFDGSKVTSITISSSARAYLKGFTITYDCAPVVEAPVIKPHTGTYYYGQNVVITAAEGTTIHYTTDGSEPTIDSDVYSGSFWPAFIPGRTYTVKAIAVDGNGNISPVSAATYTWATPSVTITPGSKDVAASSVTVMLTPTPPEATIYYTTDGSNPTTGSLEYIDAFSVNLPEVGDQVTVKAIAVVNDYYFSEVASATYTRVEKVIDVNAPFFSPLENQTYYGAQTLQIASTTPNADIYYEIVEVDGTTAPAASTVDDPTKASTHYDGTPINLTVGKSYYVKAIAYVGDFASAISEGWYIIKPFTQTGYYYQNLKDFNDNCPTDVTAHLVNPVQVVYHSTYTNDGAMAEYCYVRDNTDYALIYFGKADQTGKHIFEMGDWIDGSKIEGVTSKPSFGYHIQIGTSSHEVTSWPSSPIGHSAILPEETTCKVIYDGTQDGENSWGHYVHLRYSTLSGVADESASDMKHNGYITDQSGTQLNYYDKFYRWSAGTCSYGGHNYTIHALGDYDQNFFDTKQAAGATFDVYGIVDYYDSKGFQVCPIDFLWAYQPVITPASNDQCTSQQEVEITVQTPEWTPTAPTIYYKTDDMDDWAVYTGPILVNSDTHIEAYAAIPAEKTDGTNYNDVVLSDVVSADYEFVGIEEPSIDPGSMVIETNDDGQVEPIDVKVTDHNEPGSGAVTIVYVLTQDETMDGFDPYDPTGAQYTVSAGEECILDEPITRNTTVLAISYVVVDGEYLWSNPVTATYTFVERTNVEYNLLKTAPQPGNVYVIVNKEANMGMSTVQNFTNRGSVGVLFKENTNRETVYGNNQLAQFVLEDAHAGRYYFKNINGDGGYLVVTTNDNANLTTSEETSTYSEASVVIGSQDAGYPATIMFNYDGTNRYLRYFANGRTFSTHGSASINEDVFLYGTEATPLAYIEEKMSADLEPQVTVSDQLIGVWAVVNPSTGDRFLWAKDQGNVSIDKRPERTDDQMDYVHDILGYNYTYRDGTIEQWDESNWVILDFSELPEIDGEDADYLNPEAFVGHKITAGTVIGKYVDDVNYRIVLQQKPGFFNNDPYSPDASTYPGWTEPFPENLLGADNYYWGYNTYVPANFMPGNHNRYDLYGNVVGGFVADESALPGLAGDQLYFVNPKIQEVAHIWAVWCGNDPETGQPKNLFSVYKAEHKPTENINAWNLNGTFRVKWDYNRKANDDYGPATGLIEGVAYEFHAAVIRPTDNRPNSLRADGDPEPQGILNEGLPSPDYVLYPLDIKEEGTWTAVVEKNAPKTVVGVSYYNLMGVESKKPFDGVNIIVTRYSDGSTSTAKVLR